MLTYYESSLSLHNENGLICETVGDNVQLGLWSVEYEEEELDKIIHILMRSEG